MNISIKVNHHAEFKCLQTKYEAGLTGLQFDWIKWDMPFAVSEHDLDFGNFTVIEDTNSKYTQKPSKEEELYYVSYLWIHNVTQDDIGLYSCIVCNQYGRDYRSAFLSLNTTAVTGWLTITYCTFIHDSYINHFLKKDSHWSWTVHR